MPCSWTSATGAPLDRIEQEWSVADLRLSELDKVSALDNQHVVCAIV